MMSSLHGIRALTNSLGDTLGENTAQLSETEQQRVGKKDFHSDVFGGNTLKKINK